jgi:membrane protein
MAPLEQATRGNSGALKGALIATAVAAYGVLARRREREATPSRAQPISQGRASGQDARRPTEIPAAGWWAILKRTWQQMSEDNVSILAAGVAFYALLSIFPALTAVVSLYGLVADPNTVEEQINAMQGLLPPEAVSLVATWLHSLVQGPTAKFGVSFIVSLLLALWSARSGTGMLMTAINICYGETEKRNVIWFNVTAFALTAGLVLFGILALVLVAVLPAALNLLPLPETWRTVIALVRWPILAGLIILFLAIVYRYAPDRAEPKWGWVSWGAAAATVLWILASIGFSIYVSRFGSYDKTYGSLGAVIILLLWFYLTSYVILAGAELNAEMERQTAHDTTDAPPRPMGQRRATMADTVAS